MKPKRLGKFLASCATVALWSALIDPSLAETLTQEANLRARPSAASRLVGKLDAGTEVVVERSQHGWSLVSAPNMRGYLPNRVVGTARPITETAQNPNCDLGYPYSGSGAYFGGLTELRTSDPLGALFGYHISRPC